MADARKIGFGPIAAPAGGVLIVFADDSVQFGPRTRSALGSATDLVARAAKAERFTGKSGSTLDIVAPSGLRAGRLVVVGTGKAADRSALEKALGDRPATVRWHPFQLNPDMPREGIDRRAYRTRKFGSWERSLEFCDEELGEDMWLFASDWPHGDTAWP